MHAPDDPNRDPHTRMPKEILAVYALIFGGVSLGWLHAIGALPWFALFACIVTWLRDRSRTTDVAAHAGLGHHDPHKGPRAVLANRSPRAESSPGSWAGWRATMIEANGRVIPILGPIEWSCQWLRHYHRRFASLSVIAVLLALWLLWSQHARVRGELTRLQALAKLQMLDAQGSTLAASPRRNALDQVIADRAGDLRRFVLSDWDLDRMVFPTRVDLREAKLARARLGGAILRSARLEACDLEHAHLALADLGSAELRGANLRGAHLPGADLSRADLRHADLRDANLSAVSLRDARLCYARVAGAVVTGADLHGADLTGVDMRALEFGRHAVLCGARFVAGSTVLPAAVSQWVEQNSATRIVDGIAWTYVLAVDALRNQ